MFENINHSFIVRIWIEPREIASENLAWRGMVQHVMSGERTYFRTFEDMVGFISRLVAVDIPGIEEVDESSADYGRR